MKSYDLNKDQYNRPYSLGLCSCFRFSFHHYIISRKDYWPERYFVVLNAIIKGLQLGFSCAHPVQWFYANKRQTEVGHMIIRHKPWKRHFEENLPARYEYRLKIRNLRKYTFNSVSGTVCFLEAHRMLV